MQFVKDLQNDTLPKNYQVFSVDTLEHNWDYYCHIPETPAAAWAQDGQPKWLVFVDLEPWNKMWAHSCKYYYLPKSAMSYSGLPILAYDGQLEPDAMPVDFETEYRSTPLGVDPQTAFPIYWEDVLEVPEAEKDNLFVVMMAGGSAADNNHMGFYNDCAFCTTR